MTKRKRQQGYYTKRMKAVQEGSNEEVLLADIRNLLKSDSSRERHISEEGDRGSEAVLSRVSLERGSNVEVRISALSSTGDGLGISPTSDHVFIVPFTLPGDVVNARVVTHFPQDHYTTTDFLSVVQPSSHRHDALVQCPYFAKCSGCQFQMLSYEEQLAHKKTILEKAYRNFSNLAPELIPAVGDTIGSPMQYGYRTKLTPHFDGPPGSNSRKFRKDSAERPGFSEVPPIGFMVKGTRRTMDIEDCPIGTDAVRDGLKKERKRIANEISKYKRGATILLRETTVTTTTEKPQHQPPSTPDIPSSTSNGTDTTLSPSEGTLPNSQTADPPPSPSSTTTKTYLTDQNALSTEHIGPYTFLNPAGAFFQNNNSILPIFTSYIRAHILPPPNLTTITTTQPPHKITHLIDTYSGSGLFSITLSPLFTSTLGIDIAPSSIASATSNARLNNIPNATFITGDSANIFAHVMTPAEESVVVIDPPRKGCDDGFLRQLLRYGPARVVYVSCNVHTQARDVGILVRGGKDGCGNDDDDGDNAGDGDRREKEKEKAERADGSDDSDRQGGKRRVKYRIETLQGFDFFPQTGHVEGVAILQREDHEQIVDVVDEKC
ncbi:MAG: hypothetical protein Q9222_000619 [Ikaeria aurantiellina]